MIKKLEKYIWDILRLLLGWIFFWSFIDKFLGLGFATCRDVSGKINFFCNQAFLFGGSPTEGFLIHQTRGFLGHFFQQLVGNWVVDYLFMMGLLFVGITLLFGYAIKMGSLAGMLMLFLIYLSYAFPPIHNPILESQLIYIFVLIGIYFNSGKYLSFFKKT